MDFKKVSDKIQAHQTEREIITELRNQYRTVTAANNQLVDKLWDVKHQLLNEALAPEAKTRLLQRKASIEATLQEKNYSQQLSCLVEEIKRREVEYLGRSDFNGSSPFTI